MRAGFGLGSSGCDRPRFPGAGSPASPGTPPGSLCVEGGGLAAVTWRDRGSRASTPGGARPGCVRGSGLPLCAPGCGARLPPRLPASPSRVSPGGVLSGLPSPPPPRTLASLCAAGEGTERKGGESYFSKLLSCSGGRGLPCDSRGGREGWGRLGRSDFPECRGLGAAPPRSAPAPRVVTPTHPPTVRWAWALTPPRGPGAGNESGGRRLARPPARGRGGRDEPPTKVAVSLPARAGPRALGRPGACSPLPAGECGGPRFRPRRASPCGVGMGGSCANRAARKTKLGRHVNMYAVTEVRELMWREGRPVADPGPRPVGAVVP